MNFEIEYIEKLANLIDEKSLSDIILEDGEQAITINREINQTGEQSANPVAIMPQTPQQQIATEEKEQANTSSSKGTPQTTPTHSEL